jgi:hypothetical protein
VNRCGAPVSAPHSSVFARLASGAFYETIVPVTFYEIINLPDLENKMPFFKKTIPKSSSVYVFCLFAFLLASRASAEWETGAKIGFDSNIDRAIDNEQSDTYLSASLSFLRGPSGESRIDWTLAATLEGSFFFRLTDLSYGALTLAPGITLIPHRVWTINLPLFSRPRQLETRNSRPLPTEAKSACARRSEKTFTSENTIFTRTARHKRTFILTLKTLWESMSAKDGPGPSLTRSAMNTRTEILSEPLTSLPREVPEAEALSDPLTPGEVPETESSTAILQPSVRKSSRRR